MRAHFPPRQRDDDARLVVRSVVARVTMEAPYERGRGGSERLVTPEDSAECNSTRDGLWQRETGRVRGGGDRLGKRYSLLES